MLLECLPYFTIIVCNFCIVAKMMKSNNFRKKFRNVEEQQQPRSEVARECITRSIKFCRSGSGSRGGGRRSWRRRAASAAGEEASSAAADQRQSPRTSLSPASAPERPSVKKQRAYFQRKQKEEHQMGYILNGNWQLFCDSSCKFPLPPFFLRRVHPSGRFGSTLPNRPDVKVQPRPHPGPTLSGFALVSFISMLILVVPYEGNISWSSLAGEASRVVPAYVRSVLQVHGIDSSHVCHIFSQAFGS